MNKLIAVATATAALSAAAVPAAVAEQAPQASSAALRQVEGTVVSVNRDARTFRLRDEGVVRRVRVNRNTRFQGLAGFRSLHRGQARIEATVRSTKRGLLATIVERSGGNDRGGGRDD